MYKYLCNICDKSFERHQKYAKYCSMKCYLSTKRQMEIIKCIICNKYFIKKHLYSKYCSIKCRDKNKSKIKKCLVCDKKFRVHLSVLNRGNNAGKFCSQPCYATYSKNINNPNWRGGNIFDKNTKNYALKILNPKIRKRDKYTCQKCGKKESDCTRTLEVHHIIPYRLTQDNSYNNLTTLCINCHKKEAKNELKYFK